MEGVLYVLETCRYGIIILFSFFFKLRGVIEVWKVSFFRILCIAALINFLNSCKLRFYLEEDITA